MAQVDRARDGREEKPERAGRSARRALRACDQKRQELESALRRSGTHELVFVAVHVALLGEKIGKLRLVAALDRIVCLFRLRGLFSPFPPAHPDVATASARSPYEAPSCPSLGAGGYVWNLTFLVAVADRRQLCPVVTN